MDLIEGTHLDVYVKQHNLNQREILELMRTVCHAVQYAHQNGVIHRDLKPSNIMVTEDGQPYIVDFGLAKSLIEDDSALTVSAYGEAVGTPAYMSPEQAAGHNDKVDTRTDVYSLGVMLFTLLTGANPHDLAGSRFEVMHRIAEDDVRRPRALNRKIDRDIESLLLKVLDRDPDRRYSSAAGLTEDINNYLTGAPLIAGPQSQVHQLKKFVPRNRALVTGVVAVAVALMAGLIVSTTLYFRAEQAAENEAAARAESEAVTKFLWEGVLASVSDIKGRDATVADVLKAAAAKLEEGELQDQPLVEASIRWTFGKTYQGLGDDRAAIQHMARASQIPTEQPGKHKNPATNVAMNYLAIANLRAGQYTKAERLFDELIEAQREREQENTGLDPWYKCNLACVCVRQGRYEEAEQLLRTTLETGEWGSKSMGMVHYGHLLVDIHREQGLYEKAEQTYHMALEAESKFEDPSMQAMRLWKCLCPAACGARAL